ncbi:MAG: hypothetical protein RDU20_19690 [Desulfomonilaceae bacterium]|nr:hypothetical protein [Desulfomonilaceae bacterium]
MKRLILLAAILALVASSSIVLAGRTGGSGAVKKLVNCCFPNGSCVQTNRENCELKKARVVRDCKQCRPVIQEGD